MKNKTFLITENKVGGKTISSDHIPAGWHYGTADLESPNGHKIDFSKMLARKQNR